MIESSLSPGVRAAAHGLGGATRAGCPRSIPASRPRRPARTPSMSHNTTTCRCASGIWGRRSRARSASWEATSRSSARSDHGSGGSDPRAVRVEPLVGEGIVGPTRSLLAPRSRTYAVEEDPEEPRLERRPALESVDAAEHREPRVLRDLLCDGPAADGRLRQAEQPRLVATNELDERSLVTGLEPADQRRVVFVFHCRRGYDQGRGQLGDHLVAVSSGAPRVTPSSRRGAGRTSRASPGTPAPPRRRRSAGRCR